MKNLFFTLLLSLTFHLGSAQVFDVDTIQYNGSIDTLINMVILGDGYTQSQLDQFVTDATDNVEALFKEVPFANYQNYFNVFIVKVPSNESGAASDPNNLIDNYYGSTFNAYGIQRLLVPMRQSKVTNVLASNFPSYDQVLMIVNDTRYGGSGGWISTSSLHSSAFELTLHELGHSFAKLIDEYWAGDVYAHEGINMTQETDLQLLRWKNWYSDQGVGLYPHSESPSWYRPHQYCKMRYLGPDFCAVCKEGIIEKIHSLVSPLLSYTPQSTNLSVSTSPLHFQVNLIQPIPNTLKVNWVLNNSSLNENTQFVDITPNEFIYGSNHLSVSIEDTTSLLRVDNHSQIHLSVLTWDIEKATNSIKNTMEEMQSNTNENLTLLPKKAKLTIFPNPFHNDLTIKYEGEQNEKRRVELIDLMGNLKYSEKFNSQESLFVNTSNLSQGLYILKIYTNNKLIATSKIVKR